MKFTTFAAVLVGAYATDVQLVCEYGGKASGNAAELTGNSRCHSGSSFNMLGGGFSASIDASQVNDYVTATVYLVSPNSTGNYYCDAPASGGGGFCMELDTIELNGKNLAQTTWHTTSADFSCGDECQCDTAAGCWSSVNFNSTWASENSCSTVENVDASSINTNEYFQVTTNFTMDGDFEVYYSQDGKEIKAFSSYGSGSKSPSAADKALVVDQLTKYGAVIVVSLWQGWAPGQCAGTWGSLPESTYQVKNITVAGTTVQTGFASGPTPSVAVSKFLFPGRLILWLYGLSKL
mmetsp:Transcript_30399/g.48573  ORF Transcript_30399/g.48573 Transcript_30399/m.48573 type:complete len:293 (+) Transcript_30399:91-969(+)